MIDEAQRRYLVRSGLRLTRGTALAADCYQLRLLVRFIWGELTMDQVCSLTEQQADVGPPASKTSTRKKALRQGS